MTENILELEDYILQMLSNTWNTGSEEDKKMCAIKMMYMVALWYEIDYKNDIGSVVAKTEEVRQHLTNDSRFVQRVGDAFTLKN
jgi:hypothetical protein